MFSVIFLRRSLWKTHVTLCEMRDRLLITLIKVLNVLLPLPRTPNKFRSGTHKLAPHTSLVRERSFPLLGTSIWIPIMELAETLLCNADLDIWLGWDKSCVLRRQASLIFEIIIQKFNRPR